MHYTYINRCAQSYSICHAGIESVFSKIGCDVTTITDMLGGHAGVTDNTVIQYLGIVEQRTNLDWPRRLVRQAVLLF